MRPPVVWESSLVSFDLLIFQQKTFTNARIFLRQNQTVRMAWSLGRAPKNRDRTEEKHFFTGWPNSLTDNHLPRTFWALLLVEVFISKLLKLYEIE